MTENPILNPKWKNRTAITHAKHLKEYSGKSFKIALLGDSMMERWKDTKYWNSLQEKNLQEYCANLGVGGDEIQHLLYRISGEYIHQEDIPDEFIKGEKVTSILDVIQPEKIILMIGTNNSSTKRTPKQIAEGLSKVIEVIFSKQPKVSLVIYGITCRTDVSIEKIRDINNLYQEIIRNTQNTQISYRTLDITQEDLIDNVHLSEEGYRKWYEDLKNVL